MDQQAVKIYTIWLDDVKKIASFHVVAGYRQENFNCHDFFWKYVQALGKSGYRFQ